MTEAPWLPIILAMFGLLCAILGWIGSGMSKKLDRLQDTLQDMASDLHERINLVEHRVTKIETRCEMEHTK